jgi:hypothetical protein
MQCHDTAFRLKRDDRLSTVARPRSSTMSSSGEVRQAAVLRACAVTPRRGRTSLSSKSSRKNRRVCPLTGHPRSATQSRLAASDQIDRTRRAHVSRRLQLRRRAPWHFGLRAIWQPLGQDPAKDIALYPRYSVAALGSYRASCQRNSSSARRRRITPDTEFRSGLHARKPLQFLDIRPRARTPPNHDARIPQITCADCVGSPSGPFDQTRPGKRFDDFAELKLSLSEISPPLF